MIARIWGGSPTVASVLFLIAAIVAFVDFVQINTGNKWVAGLVAAAIVLIALGLLAI